MNNKQTHLQAMVRSKDQNAIIVVVRATPGELQQPYYTETFSLAIPREQIVAFFAHGKLAPADYVGQELTPEEFAEFLRTLKKDAAAPPCPRCGTAQQKSWLLACQHAVCRECVTDLEEIENICNPCRWGTLTKPGS